MIGKTISHYRIVEKLGEGGMGVVYKAEDTKLNRPIALKFLPPELTRDPEAKERFVREAQAAASLNHPHICTIHEIDEHENQSFIAMEFVEGASLQSRTKKGPVPIDEVLSIAVQIGEGLEAAHDKGIVHRDIKSANIMLTVSGQVKIMDFGLAKLSGATMVTREGTTLGTAGYMSPEQVRGEETDRRTDIWSLGVVLYEMLTGLLPFRGEYEQALVFQILNAVPEPVTSLRTGVPVEFERIVSKCLEKDRGERYQTAADLIADLRHLQRTMGAGVETSQRATAAAPKAAAPAAKAPRPARKMRWWYWAAPLLVVAAIVAILLVKMPRRATVPAGEKSIAVLPFVDMSPQHDQEYFCDGITEELINRLSNIQGLRVPARTSAFFFKGKTGDIPEIGSKLKVQTVLEGSVRKAGDELRITAQLINVADGYHIWSETYDRKLENVFAIQDEISSAIVNALQLKLTPQEQQKLSEHPIEDVKAYECYLRAQRQISRFDEKSIDSALVYLRTALDIMGDNAELYAGMGRAYWQYVNIGVGQEEYLARAKEYADKALALKPNLPIALGVLKNLAYYGDYPENVRASFRYDKKAVAVDPLSTDGIGSLAVEYLDIGKPLEALRYVDMLEQRDPLNVWRYEYRGLCYEYECQFERATEQYRAFYQADSTSPLAVESYSSGLAHSGKRDEALAIIERASQGNVRNVGIVFCLLTKYALLKDKESALLLLTPEIERTCRRDFEWSYIVAQRLAAVGATDEALDWLENAVHHGFIAYPYMQCDPFLDNIRGEERFKKLMAWAKNEWEHFEVPE
jgi:TolB-like protein/predicted Ser/Thr protein kinase